MTLKFENTANIGDTIKAFDFEPRKDAPDRYLIGKVIAKGSLECVYAYTVEVIESPEFPERVGHTMYVPYEMSFTEFDNRITKIN